MSERRGTLIVVSGPSGVGKSTLISELLRTNQNLYFSVSMTTRSPREGEVDGGNYFYVDKPQFEKLIDENKLLEYAEYVGNYYGTPTRPIDMALEQGKDVILDIEVQGAAKVKALRNEAVLIFVVPPSFEELEHRLRKRHTEKCGSIEKRLRTARLECQKAALYDYIVINRDVKSAVEEINSILVAEKCRTKNRMNLVEGMY